MMAGESDDPEAGDWQWAHLLWQRHGLRMEEYAEMPRSIQLAYIASEQLELKRPMASMNKLEKVYIKNKRGKK